MSNHTNDDSKEMSDIKDQFQRDMGFWDTGLDFMLERDPSFITVLRKYLSHPHREGPLNMKTKALISVAVNVSPTVLNQEGARHEMDTAFQTGATVEELLEVIQMAVAIANHSVVTGALTLGEEADIPETFGQAEVENQDRIRESFKTKRGYWDAKKEPRLKLDSDHFERYLDLSAYPWEHGVLDDKTRELIYIALDASATHTFEYGVEAHIENAIELGATSGEVMETLQLAASIGLYSVTMGAQTLEQVAQEHDKL